jgi:hypothetical protein
VVRYILRSTYNRVIYIAVYRIWVGEAVAKIVLNVPPAVHTPSFSAYKDADALVIGLRVSRVRVKQPRCDRNGDALSVHHGRSQLDRSYCHRSEGSCTPESVPGSGTRAREDMT